MSTGNAGQLLRIPESALRPLGLVGKGGFGLVHSAEWRGARVAVKSLMPDAAEVGEAPAKAFEREMRALASLQHPNIVQVLGVVRRADGSVALVEELAEGGALWAQLGGGAGALLSSRVAARRGGARLSALTAVSPSPPPLLAPSLPPLLDPRPAAARAAHHHGRARHCARAVLLSCARRGAQ